MSEKIIRAREEEACMTEALRDFLYCQVLTFSDHFTFRFLNPKMMDPSSATLPFM